MPNLRVSAMKKSEILAFLEKSGMMSNLALKSVRLTLKESELTGMVAIDFRYTLQGGTSVVVPYCYLFLMSVFILWFSYYVSDIFCKF